MSVWADAIIGHRWAEFSETTIQRISWAATGRRAPPKWSGFPEFKTAAEEFDSDGNTGFYLPDHYALRFSRNVMKLATAVRWSRILMYKGERRRFLTACKSAAQLAGAEEMILCPEGVLDDLIYAAKSYEECRRWAEEEFGPPDLDIRRFYGEAQIRALRFKRIHYFRVRISEI